MKVPAPSYDAVIESPVGKLGIRVDSVGLTAIDFLSPQARARPVGSGLAADIVGQIERYFGDPLRGFHLPLNPQGTRFQARVWQALRYIPPGRVHTYGELACLLGSSPRAVGGACRANPVPIVIPCHRVVAASGSGGYAGATRGRLVEIKRRLLRHEGISR